MTLMPPLQTPIPNFSAGSAGRITSSRAGSLLVLERQVPQYLQTRLFIRFSGIKTPAFELPGYGRVVRKLHADNIAKARSATSPNSERMSCD